MGHKKYLAFDIETAKVLPEKVRNLLAHRPLGICCIGTWASDEDEPRPFYSGHEKNPASRMSREDVSGVVDFLMDKAKNGYAILTWNGLGFDFDVLAEESGRPDDCRQLASQHVDAMFHVFCSKGFPVSLHAAAQAIGEGKSEKVKGARVPLLWKEGKYEEVLGYVRKDCRLILDVVLTGDENKRFAWQTRKGTTASLDLPEGWLTVQEAAKLPLPDTSWMDDPWPRSKFTEWLERKS